MKANKTKNRSNARAIANRRFLPALKQLITDMKQPSTSRKNRYFPFLTFQIVILLLIVLLAENQSCQSFSFDKSIVRRTTKRRTGIDRNNILINSDSTIVLRKSNENPDETIDKNDENRHDMPSVSQKTRDSLEGRSVLLTGASGGLGEQLALQIANYCNPKKLILSGRKEDALKKIAAECKIGLAAASLCTSTSGDAISDAESIVHVVTADLSDKDSVHALGESAVKICGDAVDVLINCGGVSSRSDFVDTKLEIDEKVMQINFFAGASLAKAVVPGMISSRRGGKIIWISSVQGLMGIPSRTSYAASKFAVQGYCEALRAELATSEISVHCVSPGYIRTNLSLSAVTGDGTAHGSMDETTANGADPTDVAIEILDSAVAWGKADFVVAATVSAKVAIWLRLLFPQVLQNLLVKRFEKAKKKKEAAASQQHPVAATDKKID
jgi:dehydrogenase/reductase SDR family protein 7B